MLRYSILPDCQVSEEYFASNFKVEMFGDLFLLLYDAASVGIQLLTFRDSVLPISLRVEMS